MNRWLVACLFAAALPAAPAVGQQWEDYDYENLEFRGIGVEVGGVLPASVEPTLMLGVRGDLGFVGPRVRVAPAIRFWSSSLREREIQRLADQIRRLCERQADAVCPAFDLGEIHRSDLILAADAHYLFPTGYNIEPYLGGGLSLHLLNGRGDAIEDTFVEDLLDTVAPGLDMIGGLNIELGSAIQVMTEAQFVLVSDVLYGGLLVGGVWTLPSPPDTPAPFRPAPPRGGAR